MREATGVMALTCMLSMRVSGGGEVEPGGR